jgi:hypothetical protein
VTQDVTVRLASGLMGVAPGTQVKMLHDNGTLSHVTDGSHEFDISRNQLTNDLTTAAAIQKSNDATQAAGDAFRSQQEAVEQQKQRDYIEFLRTHPLGAPTPTPK